MRTIKAVIAISFIIILIGCKKDEDNTPKELIFDPDVSSYELEVGEEVVFTDYSVGVTSRLWTFPGGNPETSTNAEVGVVFLKSGPVVCSIEVTFEDGFTETRDFVIQIGDELYPESIFGFEDIPGATEVWEAWISDGSNAVEFLIESSTGAGANGSDAFAKITVNTPNIESQLFTKGKTGYPNATLESNKAYEFGFWIKSDNMTEITAAEVSNQSETQEQFMNFAWMNPVLDISSEWSYKSITFQTGNLSEVYSEGTANNAWAQFKFIPSTTGVIYIDDVILKEITVSPVEDAYFYTDSTLIGMIYFNGASEVSNPAPDDINSSSTVIKSEGTAAWQEAQFHTFNYTIQEQDKFHISFYNPDGASKWQLRMDLSQTGTFTQIGDGDIDHLSQSVNGWSTVSVDLSEYAGEELTKIHIFPAADESIPVYFDNIYIGE